MQFVLHCTAPEQFLEWCHQSALQFALHCTAPEQKILSRKSSRKSSRMSSRNSSRNSLRKSSRERLVEALSVLWILLRELRESPERSLKIRAWELKIESFRQVWTGCRKEDYSIYWAPEPKKSTINICHNINIYLIAELAISARKLRIRIKTISAALLFFMVAYFFNPHSTLIDYPDYLDWLLNKEKD